MKLHFLVFGVALLLVMSSVNAAALTGEETVLDRQIMVTKADNVINVSLVVFDAGQPPQAIEEIKARMVAWTAECEALHKADPENLQGCLLSKSKELSETMKYPVTFYSQKDANFTFEYWNAYKTGGPGWTTVPACAQVSATGVTPISTFDGRQTELYVASCAVDKNLYKGRKLSVRILYVPSSGEAISIGETRVELSDANVTGGDFTPLLLQAIQGATSAAGGGLPCIGIFTLLGLLLASMYFSGKSPVSLLDITTPRLPSPKGFTAGGQVMAPFGYTEMKRTSKKKMALAAGVASKMYSTVSGKGLSGSDKSLINKMAGKINDPQQAAIFKTMAAEHLKSGGKISDLRNIAKPFHLMTESDHQTFRQILTGLEKAGGRSELFARTANDWVLTKNLMGTLDTLTYKQGKLSGPIQRTFGRLYGPDRYPMLGPLIVGSVDSAIRSPKILARSTASAAQGRLQFVRETGKWAVERSRGKAGLAEMEKSSPWLFGQLTKKPKQYSIGTIMAIDKKMTHLYATLYEELHRDQMRYLLKRIYQEAGVNLAALTDDVLHELSHKNLDFAKIAGYDAAKLEALERKLHAILGDASLSVMDKKERLEHLLREMGGRMDTNYTLMKERLDAISRDETEGHVKLVSLMEHLEADNMRNAAAKAGESRSDSAYYSMVGRSNLRGSDLMEVAILRKAIADHENGQAGKNVTLQDFMRAVQMDMEDRYRSINSAGYLHLLPEYMRDKGVATAKTEQNRKMFASLLTEDGERVLKDLTGKTRDTASITDFMSVLYGNDALHKSQGIKVDPTSGVHLDPKTGKALFWEEDRAISPDKKWWKVDMDKQWTAGIETRSLGQVGAHTEAKFTRSYVRPTNAAIEAQIDRYAASKTWSPEQREMETKKLWVRESMEKDLHNNFNDRFALNAYGGTTNETMRYYANVTASILTKALRDHGYQENHEDMRFLSRMDVTKPEDMRILRDMLQNKYKSEFRETLKAGVSLDDIMKSKNAWIMTYEGAYVPYRSGMPVSDNDRILGGHVALRDNNGVMRRYIPEDVQVSFGSRDDLAMAFNKAANSSNKKDWDSFLNNTVSWARENGYSYEREKVLGAVLWRYGNTTYDYGSYWNKSAVELVPRHEAMPLAPSIFRHFGAESGAYSKAVKPFRDVGQMFGHWMVRAGIGGVQEHYWASYAVAPESNVVKINSWRNAVQILRTDWDSTLRGMPEHERRGLQESFRNYALEHGRWAQVQAFTIDRHPGAASTSEGAHSAFAAGFPGGPSMPINIRSNLRAYLDKYEYGTAMAMHLWPTTIARRMIMPYQKMVAGPQRSMTGYASRWDTTFDPLRPFGNYTEPRLLEAIRGYNPMSVSHKGWFGKFTSKANIYESRANRAQVIGADHESGLEYDYLDQAMTYKGVSSVMRKGLANPGVSYMDTKFNEQLSPRAAEYLSERRNTGGMAGYFKADPYVQRMANSDTIRRTVSAEALAIRREQELMGFTMWRNSLFTFFNPPLAVWHMGFPLFPQKLSPKELVTSAANRLKRGYGGGSLTESAGRGVSATYDAFTAAMTPWNAARTRYCRRCGKSGQPGICSCGGLR